MPQETPRQPIDERTYTLLQVVVAQLVFPVGFIAYKENTLRTGREVTLQTLPIDPRDPFRGDFVILRYVITDLQWQAVSFHDTFRAGDTVYVQLADQGSELRGSRAVAVAASPLPDWDLFICDVVTFSDFTQQPGQEAGLETPHIHVQYGIESYFVAKSEGLKLQGAHNIKAVVSIDGEGRSILRRLLVDGKPFQTN